MVESAVLQNRPSTICLLIILHELLLNATVFAVEENSRSAKFATRINKRLPGHGVKQFASPSLMSCSHSRLGTSWCRSTNFKESLKQGEKGTCELNKRENAPAINDEDNELVDQPGVSFSVFLKGCQIAGCRSGGSCLFDKKKETFSCSCKLPWSGEKCDVKMDIDECIQGSHNCLPSLASCINTVGSYSCSCNPGYVGDGKKSCKQPEECQNYTSLDSADRKVTYNNSTVNWQSDDGLGPGWFRFEGAAGTRMASRCPYEKRCSARFPGWLKGGHPSFEDGQRKRKVCFRGSINCCLFPTIIKVRNCSSFYVYYLNGVPTKIAKLRYCGSD